VLKSIFYKKQILRSKTKNIHLPTYLLIRPFLFVYLNCMRQSPSWEDYNHTAGLEIPRILWKPNLHYRVHKSPSLAPNLGLMTKIPSSAMKLNLTPFSLHQSLRGWSLCIGHSHHNAINTCACRGRLQMCVPHISQTSIVIRQLWVCVTATQL
jgi:hypothetical protein